MPSKRPPKPGERLAADAMNAAAAFAAPPVRPAASPAADAPQPRPRSPKGVRAWEANNKSILFYCPVDLAAQLEAEVARSGRSKTQVIVAALSEYLEARA